LLEELDFPQITTTIINADNQGCIMLAHNPVGYSRTKHINIWHHFIRKLHPRGEIISKSYKPAFHGSHLSRNTSYGSVATI